jgi:hypothetical protein
MRVLPLAAFPANGKKETLRSLRLCGECIFLTLLSKG